MEIDRVKDNIFAGIGRRVDTLEHEVGVLKEKATGGKEWLSDRLHRLRYRTDGSTAPKRTSLFHIRPFHSTRLWVDRSINTDSSGLRSVDKRDVGSMFDSVQDGLKRGHSLHEALEETVLEQQWVRLKRARVNPISRIQWVGVSLLAAAGIGLAYFVRRQKLQNLRVTTVQDVGSPGEMSSVSIDVMPPIVRPDPGEDVSPSRPVLKVRDREAIPTGNVSPGTISDGIGTPVTSSESTERGDTRAI